METTPIVPLPGFDRLAGLDAAGTDVAFLAFFETAFGFAFAFAFALAFGFDFALAM